MKKLLALALVFCLAPMMAQAEGVRITEEIMSITANTADGKIEVKRNPDGKATINPAFAKTSRKCPPFCIQPMEVAPGVKTVGELEVVKYIDKGGLVIDARTVEWHVRGTIPSAKSIPFTQVADRLNELGCKKGSKWDCSSAKEVMLFCNGLWCGQSPSAIRAMLREGYPASKILYYRNGMQGWESIGLTVVEGEM
tara:strand:- start:141 stop:728 length:588 start_codon:yes stop_codon:yes gene_type:complete